MDIQLTPDPETDGSVFMTLADDQFAGLFPEALDADGWEGVDEDDLRLQIAKIDQDVAFLRGADFSALAGAGEFHLSVEIPVKSTPASETEPDAESGDLVESVDQTFAQLIDRTLKSDLARELVKRGFLDRNFALYAAQFYGDFTGVDVATFLVQSVQTNTMEIDYQFTSPGAIENLLSETGEDFTRTVSAYNVAVVDHLLEHRRDLAENVVDRLMTFFDDQAREFLASYLSNGKHGLLLAEQLSARGWRDVFAYLAASDDVPADVRVALVDAAVQGADMARNYDFDDNVAELIDAHYQEMPSFTVAQKDGRMQTVVTIAERANVLIADLAKVHETIRGELVAKSLYQLTAPNLHAALDTTDAVSLDRARANDVVYAYCVSDPARYLAAVERDEDTEHAIDAPETLRAVLVQIADDWSVEHVHDLIAATSPESTLDRVTQVPSSAWPALADAHLFRASLANLEAYRAEIGTIDKHLAQLLITAGTIEVDQDDPDDDPDDGEAGEAEAAAVDRVAAAVAILNASGPIPVAQERVSLVESLHLDGPLPVGQLPHDGELAALLIKAGLVADDVATFSHLRAGGWSALEPAIVASEHFVDFVSPEHLDGMVAQAFGSPPVCEKIGRTVIGRLGEFVADTESEALSAAGAFAVEHGIGLPVDQVRRIAAAGPAAVDVTLRLLELSPPAPTEVVDVLAQLGEPYGNIATGSETEFEVPYDDVHRAVFGQLEEAGRCSTSKKRMQDRLIVKLP